ncbi:hypothetical protein GGI00_004020, partial [Coemansia sp. RSA 2681]
MLVAVVSFNLAQSRTPRLAALAQAAAAAPFDVLAVAVQELAPFAEQMRRSHATRLSPAMRRVVAAFDCELAAAAACVAALEHGAVGLAVWVRPASICAKASADPVCAMASTDPVCAMASTDPVCAKAGLGPLGASSKAAVAAALRLGRSTVAFVSAHLPAGAGPAASAARNRAFRAAAARLDLGAGRSLFDCDAVFFAGDLNYRALGCRALSPADDELASAISANAAFPAFSESAVAFAPTYKLATYNLAAYNLPTYNLPTYDPRRQPAWCDRILTYTRRRAAAPLIAAWHAARDGPSSATTLSRDNNPSSATTLCMPESAAATCLRYWSLPIAGSDHLPVFARFRLDLPRLLPRDAAVGIPAVADPLRPCYHALGFVADRSAGAVHLALTDPSALLALLLTLML